MRVGLGSRSAARRGATVLIVPALLALAPAIHAQERPPGSSATESGSISGRVLDADTGDPVAQVLVRVAESPHAVLTDGDGEFAFEDVDLRVGGRLLVFVHASYGVEVRSVSLRADEPARLEAHLAPRVIELAPVLVWTLTGTDRRRWTTGFQRHSPRSRTAAP